MRQPLEFRSQFQVLRLPLLITVFAALIFTLPHQTREIYRALAQVAVQTDWSEPTEFQQILLELVFATFGILALSILLWLSARRAASVFEWQTAAYANYATSPKFTARPWLLLWFPRLILLAVPVSVAIGISVSHVHSGFEEKVKDAMVDVFKLQYMYDGLTEKFAKRVAFTAASKAMLFSTYMTYFAGFLLAMGGTLFFAVILIDRPWLARRLATSQRKSIFVTAPIALLAFGSIIAAFVLSPIVLPQMLGALFIMSLFLIVLLLTLLQLRAWGQRAGIPLIEILVVCALVFSVLDWNDNHSIRSMPAAGQEARRDDGLANAFERWFASRNDIDQYVDKPYPIYIAAAQGGGIYAATHAASYLGEVQDLCPGFGHHLFAISGVSGGSVGASVFAALTQDVDWANKNDTEKLGCAADPNAIRSTPFQFATTSIFRQDLWSPLAASLLFPDFLQRFIFFPVHGWDRGRAWEFAIENAYDRGIREGGFLPEGARSISPLARPFLDQWNPEKYSHTPALLLNTTEVGTGKRRVVAPFSFPGVGLDFLPIWASQRDANAAETPLAPLLSAAAGLSARFPWLTPAAHFFENYETTPGDYRTRKIRIVDGGYFENSGVVTAIDVIKEIVATIRKENIQQEFEIHLLVFTSAEFDVAGSLGLGEAIDPIRTMFNARAARAGIAVQAARGTLDALSSVPQRTKVDMLPLELNGYGYPLPLGWRLSPLTEHLISYHNGSERFCSTDEASRVSRERTKNASCAKRRIYDQMR